jgi:hypothetical protein
VLELHCRKQARQMDNWKHVGKELAGGAQMDRGVAVFWHVMPKGAHTKAWRSEPTNRTVGRCLPQKI